MSDEMGEAAEDAKIAAFIEQSDKETLWWSVYRLITALHSARYADKDCRKNADRRGGLYNVVHFTADHWGPKIPGMPSFADVAKECAADDAYHNLTFAAEACGLRITGDEFIPR